MKIYGISYLILSFLPCVLLHPAVKNPDIPSKGDWDLKIEKQWQTSNYGQKPMAIPRIGCITDDGTICLYDYKHRAHFIINSDGSFKAEFGKRGEGPGEIRFPSRYFSLKNKFIIYDQPKLQYFLADGTYVKSLPIGGRFDPPELFINENEYISYKERGTGGIFSHVYLSEGRQKLIRKILPAKGDLSESSQRGTVTIIIPGLSPRLATSFDTKNQRLYYGVSDTYAIVVCDMEGDIIERFSLQRKKIKFTKSMINRLSGGERRMFKNQYKKITGKFPYLTYFQKIQVEGGLLLVFVIYFGDSWEEQQIDIFSLEGKYLNRTLFKPPNRELIVGEVFIMNGYLYTILDNGKGDRKLVKYKITLPIG